MAFNPFDVDVISIPKENHQLDSLKITNDGNSLTFDFKEQNLELNYCIHSQSAQDESLAGEAKLYRTIQRKVREDRYEYLVGWSYFSTDRQIAKEGPIGSIDIRDLRMAEIPLFDTGKVILVETTDIGDTFLFTEY